MSRTLLRGCYTHASFVCTPGVRLVCEARHVWNWTLRSVLDCTRNARRAFENSLALCACGTAALCCLALGGFVHITANFEVYFDLLYQVHCHGQATSSTAFTRMWMGKDDVAERQPHPAHLPVDA